MSACLSSESSLLMVLEKQLRMAQGLGSGTHVGDLVKVLAPGFNLAQIWLLAVIWMVNQSMQDICLSPFLTLFNCDFHMYIHI